MNISFGEEIVNLKQDIKSCFLTHSGLKWTINKNSENSKTEFVVI